MKRVSLVRRLDGMSKASFVEHWAGPHVEIVRQLPGVRGIRLGVVQSWAPPDAAWDGVGEVWFDSVEAAESAFATEPLAQRLVEDRKRFLGEAQACYVVERTIVAPPA